MIAHISDSLLSVLRGFVAEKMGLSFPGDRLHDLARGLRSAAKEFGFVDEEACARWLMSSALTREQVEILAAQLTVGETYFFREKMSFEALQYEIFPRLIDSRRESGRHLRIWSAGCATGEEPYSIAILLSKMIPDLQNWNIAIIATDINPRFLGKAEKGIYGEWSFRDNPGWMRRKYFRETEEGHYEIVPNIKAMVTFAYHNLAVDPYPSLLNNTNAIDVITCRNVLMYFTRDMRRKVIQNLYRCIVDNGWLLVGSSEFSDDFSPHFSVVNFPGSTFYKKEHKKCPAIEKFISEESPDVFREKSVSFPPAPENTGRPGPEITFSEKIPQPLVKERQEKQIEKLPPDRYEEALALYEQGCFDDAVDRLDVFLSENKSNSKALALLAMIYANQGRLSDAFKWSEKAVASDKLNPDRYYLRATILQEQGKMGEAVESLKQSLYLNQDFVLAHFTLGNLMRQQGRLKESDKYFRNALSILKRHGSDEMLAASEGLTAGRMVEIIKATSHRSN